MNTASERRVGLGDPCVLGLKSPSVLHIRVAYLGALALGEVSPSFPSPVALGISVESFFFFFIILRLEPRASHMAGKCSITEPFVTTPFLKS